MVRKLESSYRRRASLWWIATNFIIIIVIGRCRVHSDDIGSVSREKLGVRRDYLHSQMQVPSDRS